MKKSEIKFTIDLDDHNVPEKIFWEATDNPSGKMEETKAIAISIFDPYQQNTLRIDLWSKEMTVEAMKQFCIESISGMADTIKTATGDEFIADEMKALCRKLVKHLEQEESKK